VNCHSPEGAKAIGSGPVRLADELLRADRRTLDDAVFELLGAADANHRHRLVDRLYEETATYLRRTRVVEIQKQQQHSKGGPRRFTANELAADAWNAAELSDWRPFRTAAPRRSCL
jgi:hypothetical protein